MCLLFNAVFKLTNIEFESLPILILFMCLFMLGLVAHRVVRKSFRPNVFIPRHADDLTQFFLWHKYLLEKANTMVQSMSLKNDNIFSVCFIH